MQRITDFRQLFLNDIPLLTDDERHQIGICYKQHGQQAAIALGQKLVSGAVRDARIAAWSRWVADHPEGVLYCFRGGLRSQTVQQWLAEAGVVIPLVSGGYKAMRRFLLEESERLIRDLPLVIVCGRTGTGKTRVIEALPNSIDLEGIAHHRGSAFGRRPGGQPSQIDFENRLAVALLKQSLPEYAQIVLEDESRLIGRCHLPLSLQERIKDGARILIDEDLDSRVNVTLEDYVLAPLAEYQQHFGDESALSQLGEELLAALDRIQRRLGGVRPRELRELLVQALQQQADHVDSAGHRRWIEPLLRDYYDPMYDYMLQQRYGPVLFQGSRHDAEMWLKQAQSL